MSPRISRPIMCVRLLPVIERVTGKKMFNKVFISLGCVMLTVYLLVLSSVVHAEKVTPSPKLQDLQLIFSADYGEGEQIFFSKYKKNDWTVPRQISNSNTFVLHPVSSIGRDGTIWVVWSQADKAGFSLYYSLFRYSRWSKAKKIEISMKDNRAATLIVDNDNIPWLAWIAVDKTYSDVFLSRWNGVAWGTPDKAHVDNKVPDIQPRLRLNKSGGITLFWQTFADGRYVTESKILGDQQGTPEHIIPKNKSMGIKIQENVQLPALPPFITERHKATLFIKTDEGAEAVPLIHF